MNNKLSLPFLALGISAMIGSGCSKENDQNPNVNFIIADDLGDILYNKINK